MSRPKDDMETEADPYATVSETTEDDDFVKVWEEEGAETFLELPIEGDGGMLISTLKGQFPNAVGLRYKSASGGWRGVRIAENSLKPPQGGWGNIEYIVTLGKEPVKSSVEQEKGKVEAADIKQDLFVINLLPEVNDDILKEYFTKTCGEMELHEVKYDRSTGKSRGFGFIRFKTTEAADEALNGEHIIEGQKLEVRVSKKKLVPCQLFVGRLPEGTNKDDLREYFAQYGEITDSYITSPFRGFGFVTYASNEIARTVLRKSHEIKGSSLNVAVAEPKEDKSFRGRSMRRSDDNYRGGSDSRRREEYDNNPRSRSQHDRPSRNDSRSSRYGSGPQSNEMMNEFRGMLFEMMNDRRR